MPFSLAQKSNGFQTVDWLSSDTHALGPPDPLEKSVVTISLRFCINMARIIEHSDRRPHGELVHMMIVFKVSVFS